MAKKSDQKIRQSRSKVYGDNVHRNHRLVGEAWHAVLCRAFDRDIPPIPPHVVCLMLAINKVMRAAKPGTFQRDDFIDGRVYIDFAEETKPRNQNEQD